MTTKLMTRLTVRISLGLAFALLAGCASRGPGADLTGPDVIIQVKSQMTKKYLRVSHIGLGICRNSARCDSDFTFKLTPSPHLDPTDKILIRTSGGDASCLNPQPPYALTEQSTTQTVTFSAANSCAGAKAYWLYEVSCEKANGSSCGIEAEDPGVIIDGGPNA